MLFFLRKEEDAIFVNSESIFLLNKNINFYVLSNFIN